MASQISRKVTFKRVSAKNLVQQLAGREPAYPVYIFGATAKFERPEVPGAPYRWL